MAKFRKADFRPANDWISKLPAESQAAAKAEARALIKAAHLSEVRRALNVTQTELARRSRFKQGEVSRIENNLANVQLKTLEKYVEALGGTVRIVADFPDGMHAIIPVKAGKPVKSKAKVVSERGEERETA